jgi:hypothetical protein
MFVKSAIIKNNNNPKNLILKLILTNEVTAMKMRNLWISPIIAAALLMITLIVNPLYREAHASYVLDFEGLDYPGYVPYTYGGFDWDAGADGNYPYDGSNPAPMYVGSTAASGWSGAAVSGSQFAQTPYIGTDPWITLIGTGTFTWNSAYFKAQSAGTYFQFNGYNNGSKLYSTAILSISTIAPQQIIFNWSGIDEIRFVRQGGDMIAMDDFVYTPTVPIPGAVWLLGSGLIGIVGVRRKFKT